MWTGISRSNRFIIADVAFQGIYCLYDRFPIVLQGLIELTHANLIHLEIELERLWIWGPDLLALAFADLGIDEPWDPVKLSGHQSPCLSLTDWVNFQEVEHVGLDGPLNAHEAIGHKAVTTLIIAI